MNQEVPAIGSTTGDPPRLVATRYDHKAISITSCTCHINIDIHREPQRAAPGPNRRTPVTAVRGRVTGSEPGQQTRRGRALGIRMATLTTTQVESESTGRSVGRRS